MHIVRSQTRVYQAIYAYDMSSYHRHKWLDMTYHRHKWLNMSYHELWDILRTYHPDMYSVCCARVVGQRPRVDRCDEHSFG